MHNVGEQAGYTWRKPFGEMQPGDTMRLRALEADILKVKKLVAERDREIETMKETNCRERRARDLLDVARSGLTHRSAHAERDVPMIDAIVCLVARDPHAGYRRIRLCMGPEGLGVSRHWTPQPLRLAGLQPPPKGSNDAEAYILLLNGGPSGQSLKYLAFIDEFICERLRKVLRNEDGQSCESRRANS